MKIYSFDATLLNNIACARKGKFAHLLHLKAQGQTSTYFDYGELMHYLMRHYYGQQKNGETKVQARDFAIQQAREFYPTLDLPVADCEEVIKNFNEYCIYWQNDTWITHKIEEPFSSVVYEDEEFNWADEDKGLKLVAEGIIDLEVETENHNITLVDHKTPNRNRDPEKLSNQFMLYCFAFGHKSIIINHIGKQKTLKPADKFHRYTRFYSKELLDEFMQETILKVIRWLRDIEQGLFLADHTSCDKFNGCTYRQICEQSPSMREQIIKMYYKTGEEWSPWARR
jgi:hypothetical protein